MTYFPDRNLIDLPGNRFVKLLGIWQIQNHTGYYLAVANSRRRHTVQAIIIPITIYW
jgi:hypothetical protein